MTQQPTEDNDYSMHENNVHNTANPETAQAEVQTEVQNLQQQQIQTVEKEVQDPRVLKQNAYDEQLRSAAKLIPGPEGNLTVNTVPLKRWILSKRT